MTAGGSQQLRRYRIARRNGATLLTACVESGISAAEARLIDAADLKDPPPEEAFELLTPTPAPPSAPPQKDDDMASRKPKDTPISGEVPKPDYDLAIKLYREDIKKSASDAATSAQELSEAYKAIRKRAHIQPQAAKLAFKLDGMEASKRDDFLRSLNGLLKGLNIFMPRDLVDAANGDGAFGDGVIPAGERPKPRLVTIPTGPSDDSDLVDAAEPLPDAAAGDAPEVEQEQPLDAEPTGDAPADEPPAPEPEHGEDDQHQIAAE